MAQIEVLRHHRNLSIDQPDNSFLILVQSARHLIVHLGKIAQRQSSNPLPPGEKGRSAMTELANGRLAVVETRFQEAFATGDPAAPWNLLFSISDQIEMAEYSDRKNYDAAFLANVRRMALSMMHGG